MGYGIWDGVGQWSGDEATEFTVFKQSSHIDRILLAIWVVPRESIDPPPFAGYFYMSTI